MDRGFVFCCGIIVILVALFIPMSHLQPNKGAATKARKNKDRKTCDPFLAPWTAVGKYYCVESRRLIKCGLTCPKGMNVDPHPGHKIKFRCQQGSWKLISKNPGRCAARVSVPLVQQNFRKPKLMNEVLHNYLNNSYNYLDMAYFMNRADVQLPGFHKFFLSLWDTSLTMARDVMTYINKRGGWIELDDLPKPAMREKMHQSRQEDHVGLVAMETALAMEQQSQSLVRKVMDKVEEDAHLMHTLEDVHLLYKVKVVKQLADRVTRLKSFQTKGEDYSLGEYEMDNELQ